MINSFRKRTRHHKGRSIDPTCSSSPSSSSLSSPNETCYSFVRRTFLKLAGRRRSANRRRPWFLDSWNYPTTHPPNFEDNEDIFDIPIELRHIEEDDLLPTQKPTQKSKSLGDIQILKQNHLIRSASSNLKGGLEIKKPTETTRIRPKLVKQKQSLNEDDGVLPKRVFKQASMNEELLSTERLREKERVKRQIQKQASLNDDLIYHRTFDSLRDSLVSNSIQMLKNGIKTLQQWKQAEQEPPKPEPPKPPTICEIVNERRSSKEDGSDSSKDSSLQSDTSVDSEDSFASVIFVPKQDESPPISPRLKSGPTSPRLKQIHPLLKPPTSPKNNGKILIYSTPTKPATITTPVPVPVIIQPPPPPPPPKLPDITEEVIPPIPFADKYKLQQIPAFEKTRTDRLQQIKDLLLKQRPDFGKRGNKSSGATFPILRRGSIQMAGRVESIAKSLPRLLSLELFNPETDDMDSDSSGVSSPDSVDSVISVEVPIGKSIKNNITSGFMMR